MEYGLHNPHANVIIWCPFVPCGYSFRKEKKAPISIEIDCGFTTGAKSALRMASCHLHWRCPLWEWVNRNHTRRLHNPSLPSYFMSLIYSAVFFISAVARTYIKKPPNNNLLAEAAVTHGGLNELRPSVRHSPSSIIHLSQNGTKVFLRFFFVQRCAAVLHHKITKKHCYKLFVWIMNQECQLKGLRNSFTHTYYV